MSSMDLVSYFCFWPVKFSKARREWRLRESDFLLISLFAFEFVVGKLIPGKCNQNLSCHARTVVFLHRLIFFSTENFRHYNFLIFEFS